MVLITRFWHRIILDGPRISAGNHTMGFTPPQVRSCQAQRSLYLCESDHAEYRRVCIYDSKYWGKKIELTSNSVLKKLNWNRIERKNRNRHITVRFFNGRMSFPSLNQQRQTRKHEALTKLHGLASLFLHPPERHCSFTPALWWAY